MLDVWNVGLVLTAAPMAILTGRCRLDAMVSSIGADDFLMTKELVL